MTLEEMIAKVEALNGSEATDAEILAWVLAQLKVFHANGMPTSDVSPTPTPVPPVDAAKVVTVINLVNDAGDVVAKFVPEKVETPAPVPAVEG